MYGHLYGDHVLRAISKIALEVSRQEDVAARYGGEEFMLILPETDLEGAMNIAERLRKAIESEVIEDNDVSSSVTISCGVTCYKPTKDEKTEVHQLARIIIKKADEALYKAKDGGRNQVVANNEQ